MQTSFLTQGKTQTDSETSGQQPLKLTSELHIMKVPTFQILRRKNHYTVH